MSNPNIYSSTSSMFTATSGRNRNNNENNNSTSSSNNDSTSNPNSASISAAIKRDEMDLDSLKIISDGTDMEQAKFQIGNFGNLIIGNQAIGNRATASGSSSVNNADSSATGAGTTTTAVIMMDESINGGNPADEGFAEPYRIDYILNVWRHRCTDKQRMLMAMHLLRDLPPNYLSQVAVSILPKLHKDFISDLPYELATRILSMCNHRAVNNARLVSRYWNRVCSDFSVWKSIYYNHNWVERLPGWSEINFNRIMADSKEYLKTLVPLSYNGEKAIPVEPQVVPMAASGTATSIPTDIRKCVWHEIYKNHKTLEKRWERFDSLNQVYENHTDAIYCLQFDDETIVTGSRDHTVRVWDVNTKETRRIILGHTASVLCLQFDKKGNLFTGSSDNFIRKWDMNTGEMTAVVGKHDESVLNLRFDDKYLVTCSKDRLILVWDMEGQDQDKDDDYDDDYEDEDRKDDNNVSNENGDREMMYDYDNDDGNNYSINIQRQQQRQQRQQQQRQRRNQNHGFRKVRTLKGHQAAINSIAYEYPLVMSASGDRSIKIWNIETGECLRTMEGHTRGIACLHAHKNRMVTGSSDKSVKVWDIEHGVCLHTMNRHEDLVRAVQIDNNRIVSGSYDETVKIWDTRTGDIIKDLPKMHDSRVFRLQFNHRRIVSSGQNGKAVFWELGTGLDPRFLW